MSSANTRGSSASLTVDEGLGVTRTRSEPEGWSAREPEREPPPPRIGGHVLLRKLGEGGMGAVYAAYHEGLDRKVALKLVHREGPGGRAEILREAQALARLSHPNVVQVYEVGEHEGQLFVAMELVQGETLEEWQRAPGRRLGELVDAYRQAAMGLQAAHAAGLVHRDFKPANAIVGADGRVRVLDFGLARAGRRADAEEGAGGAVAGTPAYMSPEQFAGRELDARSDIFSLCVALWEVLYGERPFAGATFEELRESVSAGRRRAAAAGVQLPERLRHALERGLARDPGERWDTLEPVLAALAFDPEADPSAASRERRILFAVVAGLMVVILIPLMVLGLTVDLGGRRVILVVAALSCLLALSVVSLVYRRTLLRNSYHRRMILFIGALLLLLTSERSFMLWLEVPLGIGLLCGAHIVVGMCLVGAIFFARWMLVLAAIIAAATAAGVIVPGFFPPGMVVVGPVFLLVFGLFWRRDARRGVG